MLAKIFGVLLGIIGVTTTTFNSPALPVNNFKTKPSASSEAGRTKPTDMVSKLSTATTTPAKTTPKTVTIKNEVKSKTKPSVKVTPPQAATVKAPETPKLTTASSTTPGALSTSNNLELKTNPPTAEPFGFPKINEVTRKAIVNIICTSKNGGSFEPLSGSGVVVDPRGIILTNAHVAQYLLLQNYRVKDFLTCIGRTGSPATPAYKLKLLYISKLWMEKNYKIITSSKPMGTGENDFALLQITGSTNPDLNLPATFPAIIPETNEDKIKTGQPVLIIGYPAGFLGGIAIQRDLYVVSSVTNIGKLFTFRDGTLDVFGLGGSPVAQHGSSGGAAVSPEGKLLGIIVTSTSADSTSDRDLDALSIAHISRSLSAEIRLTLESLFASDINAFSKKFDEEDLPNLKKILADELDSKNH